MEFEELLAFDEIYPALEDRVELGFARILCTLANMTRDPKKQKPFSLDAFLPDYGGLKSEGKERRRPVKELKEKFMSFVRSHNKQFAKQLKEKKNANTEHRGD